MKRIHRERIEKYQDSPDVCERKPYPERKCCRFKKISDTRGRAYVIDSLRLETELM